MLDQERLHLFEPRDEALHAVLQAVANDLKYDEPDMAATLYTLCGRHAFALEQLDGRLSKELLALSRVGAGSSGDAARQRIADTVQALSLRARELKQGCTSPAGSCSALITLTLLIQRRAA
jgi:hypothetical protein